MSFARAVDLEISNGSLGINGRKAIVSVAARDIGGISCLTGSFLGVVSWMGRMGYGKD